MKEIAQKIQMGVYPGIHYSENSFKSVAQQKLWSGPWKKGVYPDHCVYS